MEKEVFKMTDKNDIYDVAHKVEDILYDFAKDRKMTVTEFKRFVVWAMEQINAEVTGDLNGFLELWYEYETEQ